MKSKEYLYPFTNPRHITLESILTLFSLTIRYA